MRDGKWSDPTARPFDERWHGDLIALDPSVRAPGLALFRHGVLIASARVRIPAELHELPRPERYLRVAMHLAAWWRGAARGEHAVRTVVYEHPQIYSEAQGKSKGDPNLLLGLVGVAQSFVTLVVAHNLTAGARPPELLAYDPDEWTGQVPKTVGGKYPKDAWASPRGARVRAALAAGEIACVPSPAPHDAIDGIGIGLTALGRYTRRRAFAGAV